MCLHFQSLPRPLRLASINKAKQDTTVHVMGISYSEGGFCYSGLHTCGLTFLLATWFTPAAKVHCVICMLAQHYLVMCQIIFPYHAGK